MKTIQAKDKLGQPITCELAFGMTTIFVFGSNLAGRHGKGAAKYARDHHGAVQGQGEGLQGTCYAIPTKDGRNGAKLSDPGQVLPLEWIGHYVLRFLDFARRHPELTFQVTPVGCGLSGYQPEEIAPFFDDAPANCVLPVEFVQALLKRKGQW